MNFGELIGKYKLDINGVIHIGAHYGDEVFEYVKQGIQNITLFEPLSKNFDILEQNLQNINANVNAYQVALGREEGIAKMYISSNDAQSSSLLKPKEHLNQYTYITFEESEEEVEVKTLDSFNIESGIESLMRSMVG